MKPVKQEKLMFRVPNNKEGRHVLYNIRKSLNTNSYSIWTKYTGPRPKGTSQVSTLKENAKSIRIYVESKREEDKINPIARDQLNKTFSMLNQQKQIVSNRIANLEQLEQQNRVLQTKLSLLTAGLQNSTKYRHFVDTVNSITNTEEVDNLPRF